MTQTVKEFWDQRATLGETAGTQDLILKQLEHRAILAEVNRLQPTRILEVGCGRGELAREIVNGCSWLDYYHACDNSEGMIAAARQDWTPQILEYRCCELPKLPDGPYDCIITERMLINLPDTHAQEDARGAFSDRLSWGGSYLMCEHDKGGLDFINTHRWALGLSPLAEPWHNHYIDQPCAGVRGMQVVASIPFSATYYFLSRIVNAQMAKLAGKDPDYNSRINQLALSLPADCVDPRFAMAQLWIWRKS